MSRDLCQFGDCEKTRAEVRVSYHGQRLPFCCLEHAAKWALRQRYGRNVMIITEEPETAS